MKLGFWMISGLLLVLFACSASAGTTTVCLTELWEEYDYNYEWMDEDCAYAELVLCAWKVETKSELPNGMTGWTHVGLIYMYKMVFYDLEKELVDIQWYAESGKSGRSGTTEGAVGRIVGSTGKIEIEWR